MPSFRLPLLALLALAMAFSGCASRHQSIKFEDPDGGGDISRIAGGWVADTFTGKRNALLVKSDGKAEYTYSEGKKSASDEEVDVDDAVFDKGGTAVWSVNLVYQGQNTWTAANAIQIQGPKPLTYPRDRESEWTFDHSWRLEKGYLYDVKSGHRYISLRELSGSGAAPPR